MGDYEKRLLENAQLVAVTSKYSFYINEADSEILVYDGNEIISQGLNEFGDDFFK
jgi:hypothetical protein